jgi:sugar phosphate isomerase/epimerase
MSTTRRQFLATAAGAGALASVGCSAWRAAHEKPAAHKHGTFKISLAEWSFHRALQGGKMSNLDFPLIARRDYAIDTIEYVNQFFKDKAHDEAYLKDLKQRCADNGVASRLIMIDGEGELAHADADARKQAVENHHKWIDAAAFLGCFCIRVNAAGSGTYAEQKAKAVEQQKWAAESLVALADYGGKNKIAVIVENHGSLSSNGEWLAGVMKLAHDYRVGTLPDFGNFNLGDGETYDRYKGVAEMMPYAKAVSAKTHEFDARGEEVHTDYHKMLQIVVDAGYHEHLGIEYEGEKHSEPDGVALTKALLERVRDELA